MGVGDNSVAVFSPNPHISSCFLFIHHAQPETHHQIETFIKASEDGNTHARTNTHTHAHTLAKHTVRASVGWLSVQHTHTHTHTISKLLPPPPHSLSNSVVVDRVVCNELYVSSRLLKVNFQKTASHWRGEKMIRDRSVCVRLACVRGGEGRWVGDEMSVSISWFSV